MTMMRRCPSRSSTSPSRGSGRALADDSYACSTRGADLRDVGYIHCSFHHQIETVANYLYGDWDEDLLLLQADQGHPVGDPG
jgi:Protein of unknown function (DUF952).